VKVTKADRYLDLWSGYPDKDAYERWLEQRTQTARMRTIAANIAAIEAEGFRLAYQRPLKELGW
jgi:hypothetical protein